MSAHTPRPWLAERGGTISADGRVIATVSMGMQHNAALIAAAPDLLAALRAFEAFAAKQEWEELHPEQNRPKLLAQARAALAKVQS